ncbi:MAG: hypothetical protein WCK34_05765 [Bacteroidota bacterium]
MIKKLKFLCLFLLISGATSLFSQTQGILGKGFFDNWSVGIGAGPNIFFGDLKAYRFMPATANKNELKFGGTFTLTRQISHVFAIRGQFLYSEISGTKRHYKNGLPCNEYFDGNILEGNINTTINFVNLFTKGYKPNRKFFIYGTVGIGTSSWNSKVKDLNTGITIRSTDSLGKFTTSLAGMAGIGAFLNLGDKVNLGLEWTLHGVNSDRLDETQGDYKYDAYSMVALTVTYNFNKRRPGKLPEPEKPVVPVVQPPVKETKPVENDLPDVLPVTDTSSVDTASVNTELLSEQDTAGMVTGAQEKGISFRVQIFAFRTDKHTPEEIRERYKLTQEVYKDLSDGWYRFTIGSFTSYADAKVLKTQMRKRGFRGAFIARYNNGIRVPVYGKK